MPARENNLLGSYLRLRREELGLSQEVLAPRLNMTRDELGRLERGERKRLPPVRDVRAWAEALSTKDDPVDAGFLEELRAESALAGEGDARDAGLTGRLWPQFPQEFDSALASATSAIAIWQTWMPFDLGFIESLSSASAGGAEIRCLMLDPASDVAIARAQALRYPNPSAHLRAAMTVFVANLSTIEGLDVAATIRLDTEPPLAQLYATEDRMLVGWFFPGRASTVMPQVDVPAASALGKAMLSYFDAAWARLPEPDLSPYS